jgi:hypothetical protein
MSRGDDIGDLDYEIPGPDPRFQSHGPGCNCGDVECPWYAGELAHHRWHGEWSDARKALAKREAAEALRGYYPSG